MCAVYSVLDWTTYERFNRAAPVDYDGDHTTCTYINCDPTNNVECCNMENLGLNAIIIHVYWLSREMKYLNW